MKRRNKERERKIRKQILIAFTMCHIYHTLYEHFIVLFVSTIEYIPSTKGLGHFCRKTKTYTRSRHRNLYTQRTSKIYTCYSCCLSDYALTILIVLNADRFIASYIINCVHKLYYFCGKRCMPRACSTIK